MDRNTIEKSGRAKKENSNLNLKVSMPNTDRPIVSCPETQNHLRAFCNKINSGNSYPQVQQHRLKTQKNVILGDLNINSLRNKIGGVEELIRNNIDISLFSETKLDETFPNQQFTSMKTFFAKQLMLKAFPTTVKSL